MYLEISATIIRQNKKNTSETYTKSQLIITDDLFDTYVYEFFLDEVLMQEIDSKLFDNKQYNFKDLEFKQLISNYPDSLYKRDVTINVYLAPFISTVPNQLKDGGSLTFGPYKTVSAAENFMNDLNGLNIEVAPVSGGDWQILPFLKERAQIYEKSDNEYFVEAPYGEVLPELIDTELKLRIGTTIACAPFYTKEWLVKFIRPLKATPSLSSPKCTGGEGSLQLQFRNLPTSTGGDFNVSIIKYTNTPSSAPIELLPGIPGTYYFEDSYTKGITLNSNTLIINQDFGKGDVGRIGLRGGVYKVQVTYISKGGEPPYYTYDTAFVVTQPQQFRADLSYTSNWNGYHMASCQTEGSLSLSNTSNGQAPLKVVTESRLPIKDVSPGTFVLSYLTYNLSTIKITDAKGCAALLNSTNDSTFYINFQKPTLALTGFDSSLPTCHSSTPKYDGTGGWDGWISYTVNKSTNYSNYAVQLSGLPTLNPPDNKFTGLQSNNYIISLTESGCPVQTQSVPLLRTAVTADLKILRESVCKGSNATLQITNARGGTGSSYSYSWDKQTWNNTDTALKAPGISYKTYVKDENECIGQSNSVTPIEAAESLIIDAQVYNHATCGMGNGSYTISAQGGVPWVEDGAEKYDFTESFGGNEFTDRISFPYFADAMPVDTYTFTLTDSKGCKASQTISILDKTFRATGEYAFQSGGYTARLCDQEGALKLKLELMYAVPPFTITKSDDPGWKKVFTSGYDTITLSGFPIQNEPYTLLFDDANHCIEFPDTMKDDQGLPFQVHFTKPPAITITPNIIIPTCIGFADGKIGYTISGGISPYGTAKLYKISGGTETLLPNVPSNNSFTGLAAATYRIKASDAYGCELTSADINVTDPVPVTAALTITNEIKCYGGQAQLTATAGGGSGSGYEYSWDDKASWTLGNTILKSPGTYHVYVRDGNGCISNVSNNTTVIGPGSLLSLTSTPTKDATCGHNDGAVNIAISGGEPWNDGYDLQISGPVTVPVQRTGISYSNTSLLPGSYTATITDKRGCMVTGNFTIGNITLTANANYTFTSGNYHMKNCDTDGTLSLTFTNGMAPYLLKKADNSWSMSVSNSITKSGFPTGTYTLTVIDNSGCTVNLTDGNGQTLNINFTKPALSITNITGISPSCNTANEGVNSDGSISYALNKPANYSNCSVSLVETGQIPPLNSPFTGLQAGNYTIALEEPGCTDVTYPVSITAPAPIVVTTSADSIFCKGETTKLLINPNNSNYTYSLDKNTWQSNTAGNNNYFDVIAGTYTTYVKNSNGCIGTGSLRKITEAAQAFNMTLSTVNTTCDGAANGSMTVSLNGGLAPYHIVLLRGATVIIDTLTQQSQYIRSGLATGVYAVNVNDAYGCDRQASSNILVSTFSISGIATSASMCEMKNTGQISFNIINGNPKYTLTLQKRDETGVYQSIANRSNVDVADPFIQLYPGTYKLIASDSKNCSYIAGNVIISNLNNLPHPKVTLLDSVACATVANGAVNFNVTQQTVRSPFTWYKGFNSNPENTIASNNGAFKYKGLPTGTQQIRVVDADGCFTDTSINVPLTLRLLDLTLEKITNVSCPGGDNGKALFQRDNGAAFKKGYRFEVIDSLNQTKIDSLYNTNATVMLGGYPKGIYKVQVTDSANCSVKKVFTLTEPEKIKIDSLIQRVRVKGGSDGSILTKVSGGNHKYEYQWYKVNAGMPVKLMPQIDTTDLIDPGQPATLMIDQKPAGVYRLMVRDTANCIFEGATAWMTRDYLIPEPDSVLGLIIILNRPVSCFGGNDGLIRFKGTGGWRNYRYSADSALWTTSQEIKNLSKSEIKIYVQDEEGVTKTKTVAISQPDVLLANIIDKKDANCYGSADGEAILNIMGGNSPYLVSTSSNGTNGFKGSVCKGLTGGSHTIYVKDSLGCSTSLTAFIGQPASRVTLRDTAITSSSCGKNIGGIHVSPFGGTPGTSGYKYYWKYINLRTGKDSVFVADSIANSLYSGPYVLVIEDSHACLDSFKLSVPDAGSTLSIDSVITQPAFCQYDANGKATVYISKGKPDYYILWPNGSTAAFTSGLKAGTNYSVYVTDQDGCFKNKNFSVSHMGNLPRIKALSFDSTACSSAKNGVVHSQVIQTQAKTPYNFYEIRNADTIRIGSGQNLDYAGLQNGSYQIRVKDTEGCYSDSIIALPATKLPVKILVDSTLASSCIASRNGKIYVSGHNGFKMEAGGYTFKLWNGEEQNGPVTLFSGIDPQQTYKIYVSDRYNCQDSVSGITVPLALDRLSLSISDTSAVSCYGYKNGKATAIITNGTAGYKYNVYDLTAKGKIDSLQSLNPKVTFSGFSQGKYRIAVTDLVNCSTSGTFEIRSPQPLSLEGETFHPSCEGINNGLAGIIAYGGTPAYSYNWSNGKSVITNKNLASGSYTVTVTDRNDCSNTFVFNLRNQKVIVPNLGPDITLCSGNAFSLSAGEYYSYKWKSDNGFSSPDSTIRTSAAGTYSVEVTDDEGCKGSDTIKVNISANPFNAEFLIASSVTQNDTLIIIESSWPSPDSMKWTLPATARIVSERKYYKQVIMPDTGVFSITLEAYRYDCFDRITKQIAVVPRSENIISTKAGYNDLIMNYRLYPNPTSGIFTVEVKLSEKAEGTLRLVSLAQGHTLYIRQLKGSDTYTEPYSLPDLPIGLYVLYLQAGKESRTITVVKQ
jgi:hypothetical protein